MAQIDIGKLKPTWKSAYNNSTAYVVDDMVSYQNQSYICKLASTGNVPTNTTYWDLIAAKGTDADLAAISGTVQGDLYYNNGSAIARLAPGTSGQYLETKGTGQNPVWSTVSSGNYSVHAFDKYHHATGVGHNGQVQYLDIANGNTVSFTPTHVNDVIFFNYSCSVNTGNTQGFGVGLKMSTNSTISSGDTTLSYTGSHSFYHNTLNDHYIVSGLSHQKVCTGLTVGTTYYVEQFGGVHTNNQTVGFNTVPTSATGDQYCHWVNLIHFKYNG